MLFPRLADVLLPGVIGIKISPQRALILWCHFFRFLDLLIRSQAARRGTQLFPHRSPELPLLLRKILRLFGIAYDNESLHVLSANRTFCRQYDRQIPGILPVLQILTVLQILVHSYGSKVHAILSVAAFHEDNHLIEFLRNGGLSVRITPAIRLMHWPEENLRIARPMPQKFQTVVFGADLCPAITRFMQSLQLFHFPHQLVAADDKSHNHEHQTHRKQGEFFIVHCLRSIAAT